MLSHHLEISMSGYCHTLAEIDMAAQQWDALAEMRIAARQWDAPAKQRYCGASRRCPGRLKEEMAVQRWGCAGQMKKRQRGDEMRRPNKDIAARQGDVPAG